MPIHPNSLANLRPIPFTSETAPKGRKNMGLSINEWRNAMGDWTLQELMEVIEDERTSNSKAIAAQEVYQARCGKLEAIRQVCDYTNGKPNQKQEIESD